MAILHTPLPEHIRGSVDGIVVIKHWLGKTVITAFPDMRRVVFSKNQKREQRRFADAVAYAKHVLKSPRLKAAYQARLPKGKKVFNAVIAAYMRNEILVEEEGPESVLVQVSYAQKPFLLNQERRRSESVLNSKKYTAFAPVFTSDTSPP